MERELETEGIMKNPNRYAIVDKKKKKGQPTVLNRDFPVVHASPVAQLVKNPPAVWET